jgi:hypothetical protein
MRKKLARVFLFAGLSHSGVVVDTATVHPVTLAVAMFRYPTLP